MINSMIRIKINREENLQMYVHFIWGFPSMVPGS